MRVRLLNTQSAIMETKETRADFKLLKDDKRYYQGKLAEMARELAAEQARSAEKD